MSDPAVQGKNDNYRDGFYAMVRVVNIQVVIILALVVAFGFFLSTREKTDRYFAETAEGRKMQMAGLHLPNMGRAAMSSWAASAASQIMTFGFNDIDQQFALSRNNFTREGWESFRKAMGASGVVESMMETQQILTSVPESPPTLTREGLINGKYSWSFDVPLLMTFRAGGVNVSRSKVVHLVIETIPTRENPNGVGISEWYITF
jgi:intracellular multiplication protein IcmL